MKKETRLRKYLDNVKTLIEENGGKLCNDSSSTLSSYYQCGKVKIRVSDHLPSGRINHDINILCSYDLGFVVFIKSQVLVYSSLSEIKSFLKTALVIFSVDSVYDKKLIEIKENNTIKTLKERLTRKESQINKLGERNEIAEFKNKEKIKTIKKENKNKLKTKDEKIKELRTKVKDLEKKLLKRVQPTLLMTPDTSLLQTQAKENESLKKEVKRLKKDLEDLSKSLTFTAQELKTKEQKIKDQVEILKDEEGNTFRLEDFGPAQRKLIAGFIIENKRAKRKGFNNKN